MIAALLHGRTHLNFQEFRQQNHLTFFLHVLGLLELLQPQVFQSEHQGALWDCLRSFLHLLLVGVPAVGPTPGLHSPPGPNWGWRVCLPLSLRPSMRADAEHGTLPGSGTPLGSRDQPALQLGCPPVASATCLRASSTPGRL